MSINFPPYAVWFAAIMLTIFVVMVTIASGYPRGAALMPLVVGIPGVILSAVQLIVEIRKWRVELAAPPVGDIPEEELPEFGPHTAREEVKAWIYFVGTIVGILLFGFYFTVPILVSVYLIREVGTKVHWALFAAAIYIGFIYFLFEVTLRFWVFQGLWTPQIMRALGL